MGNKDLLWCFTDPTTGKKSVSLTMLVVVWVLFMGVGLLQVFGKVNTAGPFADLFWGNCALYFGRRNISINGRNFGADKAEGDKE